MPVIVIAVPIGPEMGEIMPIDGGITTVKLMPLLATPFTVTTKLPVVAPLGTGTIIWVSLQLVGVANVLLKFAVLVPCETPKPVPVIVTAMPAEPETGDSDVIFSLEIVQL